MPENAKVVLRLYNVMGQEVQTLVNAEQDAGEYSIELRTEKLASAIYFYTIRAGAYSDAKKMLLLK